MKYEDFFKREANVVARELIGATLVVGTERLCITETEAYMGAHDLASHSSKGRTKRTEVMYGEPGTLYIYLIYGMYEMLNIVTGDHEYPAAVLIRGAGEYGGPGKLTKALGVTRAVNGLSLGIDSGIHIEPRTDVLRIQRTPRIGIPYAREWRDAPLRFVLVIETDKA